MALPMLDMGLWTTLVFVSLGYRAPGGWYELREWPGFCGQEIPVEERSVTRRPYSSVNPAGPQCLRPWIW